MDISTEKLLFDNDFIPIGIDEVGRGSLAGPVVSAAVVFRKGFFEKSPDWFSWVKDSKLLTSKKREDLSLQILDSCAAVAFGTVDPATIDSVNIHTATLLSMEQALHGLVQNLSSTKLHVLVDGRFALPTWSGSQEAIVDGDAKVFSIASASIVAKVHRDAYMTKLSSDYPEYGFEKHKGYGTSMHMQAIEKYGLTKHHRRTFCTRFDQSVQL